MLDERVGVSLRDLLVADFALLVYGVVGSILAVLLAALLIVRFSGKIVLGTVSLPTALLVTALIIAVFITTGVVTVGAILAATLCPALAFLNASAVATLIITFTSGIAVAVTVTATLAFLVALRLLSLAAPITANDRLGTLRHGVIGVSTSSLSSNMALLIIVEISMRRAVLGIVILRRPAMQLARYRR